MLWSKCCYSSVKGIGPLTLASRISAKYSISIWKITLWFGSILTLMLWCDWSVLLQRQFLVPACYNCLYSQGKAFWCWFSQPFIKKKCMSDIVRNINSWISIHLNKFRVATVREKRGVFSRSGKSQGILHQVREILNSSLKSVKSQGILFSVCHKLWLWFFLWAKGNVLLKNIH